MSNEEEHPLRQHGDTHKKEGSDPILDRTDTLSQLTIDADKDWDGKAITNPGNVDGVDISAHAGNASAHHTKTTNASELIAGLLALARLPTNLTGKNADKVDGYDIPPDYYPRGTGTGYQSSEEKVNNVIQKTDTNALLDLSGQGDVSWTDLDINTAGSGLVPTKAHAVILELAFADTGAPSSATGLVVRKNGETSVHQQCCLRHPEANTGGYRMVVVGLDSNGIIEYRIAASGADTAVAIIELMGWIEAA